MTDDEMSVDEALDELQKCLGLASGCAEYSSGEISKQYGRFVTALQFAIDFILYTPNIRYNAPLEQEMKRIHGEMKK
jgi:hypothetical protein